MPLDADTLLDRIQLKKQISRWRLIAFAVLALTVILFITDGKKIAATGGDYIARIHINEVIVDDTKRDEMLEELRTNKRVKAVFVRMDTPGGTAVGGEELYLNLRKIGAEKPVIILMRTLCTSAGYMAAMAGDHILAREASLTGSIGVIMQSFELTELAKRIGVEPVTIKSAEHKATPNPAEKFTPAQRVVIKGVVDDFQRYFVSLVEERRNLKGAALTAVTDGRIFTGSQALEAGLIDALGAEDEAISWLKSEREFTRDLPIRDHKPAREASSFFSKFEEMSESAIFSLNRMLVTLDGLVLIWQPAAQH